MSLYADRAEAGRELARQLQPYAERPDAIVLGLARGGMPVAFQVAEALRLPLDVFMVRKLGAPGHEELAMGAIASGGVRVLNPEVTAVRAVDEDQIDAIAARETSELERREREYRNGGKPVDVQGATAILVDDGLATGASMRAAVKALRQRQAGTIVVAVPVAPPSTCAELEREADVVVCTRTPAQFGSVGEWYDQFEQVTDEQVREALALSHRKRATERNAARQ
jgi:putative phosphoribosyl transferase